MKILLTGGGSGGHFYPIIAVAQALREIIKDQKIIDPKIYFMSNTPYNARVLYDNNIEFIQAPAGKVRRYFSILNFFDIFKTSYGALLGLFKVFSIYPDVVFSKGGYASFPAVFGAKILGIPVIIHESDTVPGRMNAWAGKFAKRIAVSFPDASEYFPKDKVAWTGAPIRKEISIKASEGAVEFLNIESQVPVLFILGGSLGAQRINSAIIEALPSLVTKYTILHQTGKNNYAEIKGTADVVLSNNPHSSRYKPFDYLNDLAMRMCAGVSDLIISRAGSTIFEIAAWGIPSIIIPITDSNGDHQRKNAFNYARAGAATVIEENNLTPEILVAEINRLMDKPDLRDSMKKSAVGFSKIDAAKTIAQEILNIALSHEK